MIINHGIMMVLKKSEVAGMIITIIYLVVETLGFME